MKPIELLDRWSKSKTAQDFFQSSSTLEQIAALETQDIDQAILGILNIHQSIIQGRDLIALIKELKNTRYDPATDKIRKDILRDGQIDAKAVNRAENGFYSILNHLLSKLNTRFQQLSSEFKNAKEQGEISALAIRFEQVADNYISLCVIDLTDHRVKPVSRDLSNYAGFLREKKEIDQRLDALVQDYKPKEVDFGLLVELWHDAKAIERDYKQLMKKNTHWFSRIRGKPSIFGCYNEIEKVSELKKEIGYWKSNYKQIKSKNKKIEDTSDVNRTARTECNEWIDYYNSVLDDLDQDMVDAEFVEFLASIKLADQKFLKKLERNQYLSSELGELKALERVVKNSVEKQVARVKDYLDKEVKDVKSSYQGMEEEELIPLLSNLDNVILMYKLLDEPTKAVQKLRDNIEKRIEFHENQRKQPEVVGEEAEKNIPVHVLKPDIVEEEEFNENFVYTTGPQSNYHDLATHLSIIGFPPSKYLELMNIIMGKTGEKHWINRLHGVREELTNTPVAGNWKELDYIYHFEYALREDMNSGNMSHLVRRNSEYNQIATKTLNELGEYIRNSEASLKAKLEEIKMHQALFGPKNCYNSHFIM